MVKKIPIRWAHLITNLFSPNNMHTRTARAPWQKKNKLKNSMSRNSIFVFPLRSSHFILFFKIFSPKHPHLHTTLSFSTHPQSSLELYPTPPFPFFVVIPASGLFSQAIDTSRHHVRLFVIFPLVFVLSWIKFSQCM